MFTVALRFKDAHLNRVATVEHYNLVAVGGVAFLTLEYANGTAETIAASELVGYRVARSGEEPS